MGSSVFIYFTLAGLFGHLLRAQVCDVTTNWVAIKEDQYEQNYSPVDDESARPLGFVASRFIYNSPTSHCVKVLNTAGKRIEVLAQTYPVNKLCIKNEDQSMCTEGGFLTRCQPFPYATDNSTTFIFHCTGECTESDVTFWYRFAVSPGISSENDEIWCRDRDGLFPMDLISYTHIQTTTTLAPVGRANSSPLLSTALILLAFLQYVVSH